MEESDELVPFANTHPSLEAMQWCRKAIISYNCSFVVLPFVYSASLSVCIVIL